MGSANGEREVEGITLPSDAASSMKLENRRRLKAAGTGDALDIIITILRVHANSIRPRSADGLGGWHKTCMIGLMSMSDPPSSMGNGSCKHVLEGRDCDEVWQPLHEGLEKPAWQSILEAMTRLWPIKDRRVPSTLHHYLHQVSRV